MKVWIRVWQNLVLDDVANSLLLIGLSSAECFSCRKIGIPKASLKCPECGKEFKYIAFRYKVTSRELENFSLNRNLVFVDFEDFSREFNRNKARKFLDFP
ncbi:MAG: hypothetical protein JW734_09650 [Candidatus Omnitrophica bacterium]|nr:hypothetical protein [Candidatus Omnitrophota bacterium]